MFVMLIKLSSLAWFPSPFSFLPVFPLHALKFYFSDWKGNQNDNMLGFPFSKLQSARRKGWGC